MLKTLGLIFLVLSLPLLVWALAELAGRDYVGGALIIFGSASVGHLGLELVALGLSQPDAVLEREEEA